MRGTLATIALSLFGCATATPPPPCNPGLPLVNATLYMQTAAEYQAAARQTYAAARIALDRELASPAAQPPAIILDLDETVLDNSRYAVRSIERGATFQFDEHWTEWVSESASSAIPGAAEFLNYAVSRGVTPFYITNRTADMETPTRRNLEQLGIPLGAGEDSVLVRGERPEWNTTDKTSRRDFVAAHYNVLLMFGDDLNDFTSVSGKSVAERNAVIAQTGANWGSRWFIVPNAIYYSWESAVTGSTGTPCEQLQKKLDYLQP
ncbi:MAG: 5'-nucleotidase, lipoprotein e(P4) family [Thermoanaerobaculia bacterium]